PKKDIEFHMVTLRFDNTLPKVEQVGNVLVHRIGFSALRPTGEDLKRFPLHLNKLYYQFAAAITGLRLHKKYSYDAVWSIMAHSAGVPGGLFKTFKPNIPYLLTLQEGDPIEHIKKVMFPIYPFFIRGFKKADRMQTISTYLATWGVAMGFNGKPVVIPNGVDTKVFSKEHPRRELEVLKQTLEKKINSVFLITTSRLVHKNAVDTVIKALPLMPEHVIFLIIGGGPEEKELKKLALEKGVMSRVRFLGEIEQKEIPKYLKISDIFIRPSRSEGMGNSFIEAMAAGLPIIGTQVGGITDFLFDPEKNPDIKPTGISISVDSPEEVSKAVLRYSTDVLLRREVTDNARALVEARYDWKIIVPAMRSRFFKLDHKINLKYKK
ncbi:glycosyltransferase family 4 protein, partial [Candidatus Kaiserbacteria bacterium]|nr:glycosyltransferase family 4 protein [Candidatus Kaiserbacteria bacterium]